MKQLGQLLFNDANIFKVASKLDKVPCSKDVVRKKEGLCKENETVLIFFFIKISVFFKRFEKLTIYDDVRKIKRRGGRGLVKIPHNSMILEDFKL